jgi:tripartite ATP-independent transporter DctM subunit
VEAGVSIGKLFIGGIIPGILLAGIFILYIGIRSWANPEMAPATTEGFTLKEKLSASKGVILPFLLILAVLGAIYTGVCTPTEAAAIGAFGALLCTLLRRKLNWVNLRQAFAMTVRLNAMVCWIMISAAAFSKMVAVSGLGDWICASITGMEISRWLILVLMQLIFFLLGMFLDPAGIILITTPIFVPIILQLGFDPLWFGILFTVNMEMAYITPPFGFNLFVIGGVVPPQISMRDIYRSVAPFVLLQAFCLLLIILFPALATWLPNNMIGR